MILLHSRIKHIDETHSHSLDLSDNSKQTGTGHQQTNPMHMTTPAILVTAPQQTRRWQN
jgi:hypothetical protein